MSEEEFYRFFDTICEEIKYFLGNVIKQIDIVDDIEVKNE